MSKALEIGHVSLSGVFYILEIQNMQWIVVESQCHVSSDFFKQLYSQFCYYGCNAHLKTIFQVDICAV